MSSPLRDALGMFSVLPVGVTGERPDARTLGALPWAGAVLGALAGLVLWVVSLTGLPLLGAALGVAALALLTGGLHLDGLADTADGLGSRRTAADALAIMRRSDIGPMGVVAILLVLVLDVVALGAMPAPVAALALVAGAVLGRLAVLQASGRPPARAEGFGALFAGRARAGAVALNSAFVLLVVAGLGWLAGGWLLALIFALAGLVTLAAAALWAANLARRLGGMTGDTFGSLVELTQTGCWVLLAVAGAAIGRL